MNPDILFPMESLSAGQWAEVADIAGEPSLLSRLGELGLRVGVRFQMLRGGSPCLIGLGEGRLSLRGDPSMQILVRPLAG